MNFTQEQISDLLFDLATKKGGTHLLLKLTLDALYCLYLKGLTTEQISSTFEDVYDKEYSKQQINYLIKESKSNVHTWLNRRLERHYLVIYFDATFVYTRRDKSVSKEGYYTLLGIKEDGTHEVLSVVNYPTEGALLWEHELKVLRDRGVESVGLFVSDALTGVKDEVKRFYLNSKLQLCGVHLKRVILSLFPNKEKENISKELNDVMQLEIKKYPSLKRHKASGNIAYFTYLEYLEKIQRIDYSTNWIERLNRDYKRVLKIHGAMPTPESVIALMGAVVMEKEDTTMYLEI